jgi:predicted amidophosphoribosyltransferase
MPDFTRLDEAEVPQLCQWCKKPFNKEEAAIGRVCARCLRLLRGAGLTDEEIYRSDEDGSYG